MIFIGRPRSYPIINIASVNVFQINIKNLPGFVAENQDVLDIEGAADHMVLHLLEVHNLDQVEVEDLLANQKEVLDVVVTFDDEDDKGMAAVVGDRKEVLSEVLPRNKK